METTDAEEIDVTGNQGKNDPNRGVSKKERRRIEVLKHSLVPRIEKLETQINEQLEKLSSLSDRREGDNPEENTDAEEVSQPTEGEHNKTEPAQSRAKQGSPIEKLIGALQTAGLSDDPTALRLLAELAALNPQNLAAKARASHVIQPSGGGVPPAPDLRTEYEKRVNELRPGDIDGLMEVKREFRKRGMEVW